MKRLNVLVDWFVAQKPLPDERQPGHIRTACRYYSQTKGIRTERRLSHVWVFDIPNYHKPLVITDAAINVAPDLLTKRDIVQNAINFCHSLGIHKPKVAILAAVEKVKPAMQSTIDAAALCKMADRGRLPEQFWMAPWRLITPYPCRQQSINT